MLRQDRQAAEELYAVLQPDREFRSFLGPTTVLLGLLATFLGRLDEAVTYFDAPLKESASPLWSGWAHLDHANALLKRNRPGDGTKAAQLLDTALSLATDSGMTPLARQVSTLQARLESTP